MVRTYTCTYVRTYVHVYVRTRVRTYNVMSQLSDCTRVRTYNVMSQLTRVPGTMVRRCVRTRVPWYFPYHGTKWYQWYPCTIWYHWHTCTIEYTCTYKYNTISKTTQALRCNGETSGRCQHRRHHGILRFQLDSDVCSVPLVPVNVIMLPVCVPTVPIGTMVLHVYHTNGTVVFVYSLPWYTLLPYHGTNGTNGTYTCTY
jgi:hypothetical protein